VFHRRNGAHIRDSAWAIGRLRPRTSGNGNARALARRRRIL